MLAAEPVALAGIGGARMAEEGLKTPIDLSELSVVGLLDGLKAWPRARILAREAAQQAAAQKPAAAVLIDSWGFNLRMAWNLRRIDPSIRLIKYIGPQVWAARPGRARTLANAVDLLLTIHSFDAPLFERHGLRTVFTGNPALHRGLERGDGAAFRARHGIAPDAPVLAVLFGSRRKEIERLAEPFLGAVRLLAAQIPGLRVVSPVAETVATDLAERLKDTPEVLTVSSGERADLYAAANAAIASSGTATSELALAGVPTVIGYRIDAASYVILNAMLRTPYVSLVNVAAGEELMPERLQHNCTPDRLAAAALPWLRDPSHAAAVSARLRAAAKALKGEMDNPAEEAARAILAEIGIPARA
jgi:lipid-A-disaccharide synthase